MSHGDLTTNSGRHAHAIARELSRLDYAVAVAVPGTSFGLQDVGPTSFPVLSHRDAAAGRLPFAPDLVHAFTPRAVVRGVTFAVARAAGCAYVVHLEDDDARIEGGTPASERDAFVAGSVGVSVVVDRLLELKPTGLPGAVVWPGFDEAVLTPRRQADDVRRELGIDPAALVLVYNGNVHETNLGQMRELYGAVELLRRDGIPAVLVKTGWNFVPDTHLPRLGDGIRDLGWVGRDRVPELLHSADVLVQPGAPGGFDDYRFPSKLPEFFASGRPVVLPRTNIGLHVRDGEEALLLDRGDAEEIAEKVGDRGRSESIRQLQSAPLVAPLPFGSCAGRQASSDSSSSTRQSSARRLTALRARLRSRDDAVRTGGRGRAPWRRFCPAFRPPTWLTSGPNGGPSPPRCSRPEANEST